MELSARNQLKGTATVKRVKSGEAMAEITVNMEAGPVTTTLTDASRKRLKIKDGDEVLVVIKSTEVMIAKGCRPPTERVASRPGRRGAT